MQKYLNFIDQYSLERQHYWRLDDVYKKKQWEIFWCQSRRQQKWGIKSPEEEDYQWMTKEDLLKELNTRHIDLQQFTLEVLAVIRNMAVYAAMIINEAQELIGEDDLNQAIVDHHKFVETLKQIVSDQVEKNKEETTQQTSDSDASVIKILSSKKKP